LRLLLLEVTRKRGRSRVVLLVGVAFRVLGLLLGLKGKMVRLTMEVLLRVELFLGRRKVGVGGVGNRLGLGVLKVAVGSVRRGLVEGGSGS